MAADIHDRADVDRLYDLAPGDFVAARDALAKDVRAGDRAAATAIKALRRPTVAAWAVNTAVRGRSGDVERLLDLGQAMRQGTSTVRESMAERRRLISSLADEAVDLAGEEHRAEIEPTIEAASVEPGLALRFRQGHLERSAAPSSGLDQLLAMAPATPGGDAAGDDEDDGRAFRQHRAELQRRLDDASAAVEAGETRVRQAEQRLAEVQHDLDVARDQLRRDEQNRDALAAELGDVRPT